MAIARCVRVCERASAWAAAWGRLEGGRLLGGACVCVPQDAACMDFTVGLCSLGVGLGGALLGKKRMGKHCCKEPRRHFYAEFQSRLGPLKILKLQLANLHLRLRCRD